MTLPIPQKSITVHPFFAIFSNMEKKTERFYLSYEKASADLWIKEVAKVSGLEEGTFGLYLVSINEGIYQVGRDSLA